MNRMKKSNRLPDIFPLDDFLYGYLKSIDNRPENIEYLKDKIRQMVLKIKVYYFKG